VSRLDLEIVLTAPALLAAVPPASNLIETLRFIPGNALRGALARRYLDGGGSAASEEFRRLFLSGEVRFAPAHLDGAEVVPLSARSCKYESGFRGDGGHGVIDLLLPVEGLRSCESRGCGRPVDYFEGFWHPAAKLQARVETRLVTRTAIDPARGTAHSGRLFSQRLLAEGQTFLSWIEAPDDLVRRLADLVAAPFPAVFGAGGSRGQGWAEIAARPVPALDGRGTARARYDRFLAAARRPVLAVTLLGDALFRDDYLRDATAPSLADLAPFGLDTGDWEPRPSRALAGVRKIFGFDGVPVRLPRPPRLAVAAGSAFLFEARPGRDPLVPAGNGEGWIGEGNGEGYGRALLWHPFHLDPEGEGA
jgi:CRISPR-associated protein Csx10